MISRTAGRSLPTPVLDRQTIFVSRQKMSSVNINIAFCVLHLVVQEQFFLWFYKTAVMACHILPDEEIDGMSQTYIYA